MNKTILSFLLATTTITTCFATNNLQAQYQQATVASAMHNLKSVNLQPMPHSDKVEVTTWTTDNMPNGKQVLSDDNWVALTKQDYNSCKEFPRSTLGLNITQALGMPPLANYSKWHLVTMWVTVKQAHMLRTVATKDKGNFSHGIFRPCFSSPSISSNKCSYTLDPKNTKYDEWLLDLSNQQFKYKGGYPWTGLGYTYNWNASAKSPVGLSEFIVTKGTEVDVVNTKSAADFCS